MLRRGEGGGQWGEGWRWIAWVDHYLCRIRQIRRIRRVAVIVIQGQRKMIQPSNQQQQNKNQHIPPKPPCHHHILPKPPCHHLIPPKPPCQGPTCPCQETSTCQELTSQCHRGLSQNPEQILPVISIRLQEDRDRRNGRLKDRRRLLRQVGQHLLRQVGLPPIDRLPPPTPAIFQCHPCRLPPPLCRCQISRIWEMIWLYQIQTKDAVLSLFVDFVSTLQNLL